MGVACRSVGVGNDGLYWGWKFKCIIKSINKTINIKI